MNQSDPFFNKQTANRKYPMRLGLCASFVAATVNQKDSFADALRTYATWLVRAAQRKMADSGPTNAPQNTPEKKV